MKEEIRCNHTLHLSAITLFNFIEFDLLVTYPCVCKMIAAIQFVHIITFNSVTIEMIRGQSIFVSNMNEVMFRCIPMMHLSYLKVIF